MSTAVENELIESAPVAEATETALPGNGRLASTVLLLGIFSTGTHVAMVNGLLPEDFTALLANGMPDSSLLYAGVVLLTAAAVLFVLPAKTKS